MTDATHQKETEKPRRIDFKFWTIAALVAAILGFNVAERLLLDADEADISYARLIVPANRVTNPSPGDIFVFNHQNDAFIESRYCSLQIFGQHEPFPDVIKASNVWGNSVNATLKSVGDYLGEKLTALATVDNAERKWVISKTPRQEVRAPMEQECLATVLDAVKNPGMTPFVVDAIYSVEGPDGQSKNWVRFATPIMLDPSFCNDDCPETKKLQEIVKADTLTRFKARWGIVRIQ